MGFLIWFVVGPRGFREAPEVPETPTDRLGGLPEAPGARGARAKKPQNLYCLPGPFKRSRQAHAVYQ